MRSVVITGLGVVAPNGVGKDNYWKALAGGKSGIRRISRFDPTPYPCHIAGEIPWEWLQEDGQTQAGEDCSLSTVYALAAARQAIKDARLNPEAMPGCPLGVYMGISSTDMGIVEKEYLAFIDSNTTSAGAISSCFPHAPASQVAKEIDCSGSVITVSTGCSSGLFSVMLAADSIRNGKVDIAVAGGVDAPLTPLLLAGFCATGLLPTGFNDTPQSASRPFDAKRQGGVLAEGAGVLVLEAETSARLRGVPVYAKISGWGVSNTVTPANLRTAFTACIHQALGSAGLRPEQIDYINAHSPGDQIIDRTETRAIKDVWGKCAYNLPVSSIKSMIGSPLSASGPLQIIAAVLSMQNQYIPPTVNYDYADPRCDLDYVPNRGRTARIANALINVQGIGGGNTTLILAKASP